MDVISRNPESSEPGKGPLPAGQAPTDATSRDPKARIRNSRARQRADTKERIFETALREFREVGFAGAQIDRIAKNAGIARGTFYFHFHTKDDVMLELARRINRRGAERLALLVGGDPCLDAFLTGLVDILIDEFGLVSDAGLNAEVLSLYIRRPFDLADPTSNAPNIHEELVGHIRTMQERGDLKLSILPEELSLVIMSSLFGILARVPRESGVREICRSLIKVLVKGLQSED